MHTVIVRMQHYRQGIRPQFESSMLTEKRSLSAIALLAKS
ncbi:hypothetical protein CKA32_003296 [Geitlerinema sp. FC II]|nr:hypothetical protein CKA32_003296 [Geitlerinema sp. FC II]